MYIHVPTVLVAYPIILDHAMCGLITFIRFASVFFQLLLIPLGHLFAD